MMKEQQKEPLYVFAVGEWPNSHIDRRSRRLSSEV